MTIMTMIFGLYIFVLWKDIGIAQVFYDRPIIFFDELLKLRELDNVDNNDDDLVYGSCDP